MTFLIGSWLFGVHDVAYPWIWLNLPAAMIRLYPHVGYLLVWLFRQTDSPIPRGLAWDADGAGWIVVVPFTVIVAIGLYQHKRWACYLAAAVALLVAFAQYQQADFLKYDWFGYKAHNSIISHALVTGAFEKRLASLISGVLGITLLRIPFSWRQTTNEQSSTSPSLDDKKRLHRVTAFLFWTLVASSLMLLALAGNTVSKDNSQNQGEGSGFCVIFVLLMLILVGTAAAGLAVTTNRFFLGLAFGYSIFYSIVLFETWFTELDNSHSPIAAIKSPVWANLVVCFAIIAAAIPAIYLTRNRPLRERGLCSLGFAVSTAFVVAALNATHIHFVGYGLLGR